MVKGIKKITGITGQYCFVFIFIVIVYSIICNGITWGAAMNILRHSAVIGIVGIGMGYICLTGEVDLSLGSMLAFISGLSVVLFNLTGNVLLTLLFSVLLGAALGFINGVLVGAVKMPAFIVTLATMLIYRSAAQYICQHIDKALIGGGTSVYKISTQLESYHIFYGFGNNKVATIPIVGMVMIFLMILFTYIASCTKFGKKIYAIGSNPKGAQISGIHVSLVKILVFVTAGILVGIASFLWVAMNAAADPATTGKNYEMYAIASVVLGGISMAGGKGRCIGIIFGAMSYTVIDKIIVALKMDSLTNDAVKGLILIIVILLQQAGPQIKEWLSHRNRLLHTNVM